MTDQQRGRRAGRHNAADARPPEADQREQDAGQLPRAGRLGDDAGAGDQSPGPSDGLGITFDPGLTDLGDDGDLPVDRDDDERD